MVRVRSDRGQFYAMEYELAIKQSTIERRGDYGLRHYTHTWVASDPACITELLRCDGVRVGVSMCRNTRVPYCLLRAAAVWYNVVGGSETDKRPPNYCLIYLYNKQK